MRRVYRLNGAQVGVLCGITAVVSFLIIWGGTGSTQFYKYQTEDDVWTATVLASSVGGFKGLWDSGTRNYCTYLDCSDGQTRKFYLTRSINHYFLDSEKHPLERIALVVVLVGVMLIYTLGWAVQRRLRDDSVVAR
ncbi:hypothetical protein FJY68_01105 [candidate division WOR-3 bacterium]|uniref:Uncharacterized protein n=1 Tax=candidate division WOR-3 bacterium TaxID=2052148 RepID=A0A937XG29_UNCW3|nr:hypothetical protein [candidate division WOR-3 bacterium]